MSHWETPGNSDEWYTPKYIFEALGCTFDLDVAAPEEGPLHVPCDRWISKRVDAFNCAWQGFIWMNPPFGGRNSLKRWIASFIRHGNGIALTPDRTSAPWFQIAASDADATLFLGRKVKFIRPDGTLGKSPSNGTTLFAMGGEGVRALECACDRGLGLFYPKGRSLYTKALCEAEAA